MAQLMFLFIYIKKYIYNMAMRCGKIVYFDFNKGYFTRIIMDIPIKVPLKNGFYGLFFLYMLVA